jgi:hypothetical protein
MQPSHLVTGMVWFQAENYARLASMFEDHAGVNSSYEEWLFAAETRRQELEKSGVRVLCVELDPDEFPAWCKSVGMRLNAESRKAYTNYIACKLLYCIDSSCAIQ